MAAPYLLGVDGGATKTKAVVCDGEGLVLGSGLAGASNHHVVGLEAAGANIAAAGSVLEHDVLVRRAFVEALRRSAPLARVMSPRHEAAVGAALLAAKAYRDK